MDYVLGTVLAQREVIIYKEERFLEEGMLELGHIS